MSILLIASVKRQIAQLPFSLCVMTSSFMKYGFVQYILVRIRIFVNSFYPMHPNLELCGLFFHSIQKARANRAGFRQIGSQNLSFQAFGNRCSIPGSGEKSRILAPHGHTCFFALQAPPLSGDNFQKYSVIPCIITRKRVK